MVPSWIRFLAGIKNCYPPHMSHEGRRKEHIATRTSIYSQIHKFLLAQCRIMLNRLELIELNKLPITKCKKKQLKQHLHILLSNKQHETTWTQVELPQSPTSVHCPTAKEPQWFYRHLLHQRKAHNGAWSVGIKRPEADMLGSGVQTQL